MTKTKLKYSCSMCGAPVEEPKSYCEKCKEIESRSADDPGLNPIYK